MATGGTKGTKRARAGYARAPGKSGVTGAPARRGAGFWALIVGAVVLLIAIVAIVVTALSGTPPGGTNSGGITGIASGVAAVAGWAGRSLAG